MTRAVILVERGFQDEEFVYPYYRMLEEGWDVDVASPEGNTVYGKYGVPARANCNLDMICGQLFDAVVIPGGFESPDRLRMHKTVQMIVRWHAEKGRAIGAICHGPWVLISAGVVQGVAMTGYPSIEQDLRNAGAVYVDVPVVMDREKRIVTAQHYRDNGKFMRTLIDLVREEKAWDERHSSTF